MEIPIEIKKSLEKFASTKSLALIANEIQQTYGFNVNSVAALLTMVIADKTNRETVKKMSDDQEAFMKTQPIEDIFSAKVNQQQIIDILGADRHAVNAIQVYIMHNALDITKDVLPNLGEDFKNAYLEALSPIS